MKTMPRILGLLGMLVAGGLHAAGTQPATQQIRAQWKAMQRAANAHDTDRYAGRQTRCPRGRSRCRGLDGIIHVAQEFGLTGRSA